MEVQNGLAVPDNTAARTALWRALHLEIDAEPHIIEDEIGLQLLSPDKGWQSRPDMDAEFTKRLRASMVARARFIEDQVLDQIEKGVKQYVLLGAGLDSFAQRRPDVSASIQVFEIDQPETQNWKKQRLQELGYALPGWLHFVSVDFERSSWWEQLLKSGFDPALPTIVTCIGVSLYLTKDAIMETLDRFAKLPPGSLLTMSFYLPMDLLDEADKPLQEISEKGARAAGTPFESFFTPEETLSLGKDAGFKTVKIISTEDIKRKYFSGRNDGLVPSSGEIFLLAST